VCSLLNVISLCFQKVVYICVFSIKRVSTGILFRLCNIKMDLQEVGLGGHGQD
jgi:hypothetical protein